MGRLFETWQAKLGWISLLIPLLRFLSWLIGRAGDIEFVAENRDFFMDIVEAPWFPLLFAIGGVVLIAWGGVPPKNRSR
jgi:hypothetical protein